MSSAHDDRTRERRLSDEAAGWRKALREEQERHEVTRDALLEANRALLEVMLRDRLADPRDFEIYVGVKNVMDASGRIVWALVDRLVTEIVAQRPHFGVSRRDRAADPAPGGVISAASEDQSG